MGRALGFFDGYGTLFEEQGLLGEDRKYLMKIIIFADRVANLVKSLN